jgi:hypothetical protein
MNQLSHNRTAMSIRCTRLLALVLILSLMLAMQHRAVSPAKADLFPSVWSTHDGFESNQSAWTFSQVGTGSGSFTTNAPYVRTGSWNARLRTSSIGSWSRMKRTIKISPYAPGKTVKCRAGAYFKSATSSVVGGIDVRSTTDQGLNAGILRSVREGEGFVHIQSDYFYPKELYVVILLDLRSYDSAYGTLYVDDLGITCTY